MTEAIGITEIEVLYADVSHNAHILTPNAVLKKEERQVCKRAEFDPLPHFISPSECKPLPTSAFFHSFMRVIAILFLLAGLNNKVVREPFIVFARIQMRFVVFDGGEEFRWKRKISFTRLPSLQTWF